MTSRKATLRKEQASRVTKLAETFSEYNVFGSPDGHDTDILIKISKEVSSLSRSDLERLREFYIQLHASDINLIVVEEGVVTWVLYGTVWETNNALYNTYHLHEQKYPCFVTDCIKPTTREINSKIHRATRNILSVYSRSNFRVEVKRALLPKCTLRDRLDVVKLIINSEVVWNKDRDDVIIIKEQLKRASYQVAQAMLLLKGDEGYDKGTLSMCYPSVRVFLYRDDPSEEDYTNLTLFFREFVSDVLSSSVVGLESMEVE